MDLTRLHAHEMAALLRAGQVSSRDLTSVHLERAHVENRGLNAWLSIDDDRALAEADDADARLAAARGEGPAALAALHPLLGIPVALKDLISIRGGQCTAGSRILEGYLAPYDAHIVERLHDAGAVMLGKTNMDEFAMGSSNEFSAYGPVSNPWDLGTVPGGSSGGSAVAVAAYHTPLSIGTDTGGSIRQPAALCGIVGLKPTYGRVSRYGIVAFASSLDQIGPFARDVRDAARGESPAALAALHPLLGIPVALKDLISIRGGQCTAGSRILEGYLAPYDAHIVERLHDAGAVMLGKTNMDEFAMGSSNEFSAYGPVSNPWDLGTVPGGSSGGSAVAVAAYHAPLSIGTDTGGSIRQPAALCGIVGLKPTYGRVSRYGIVAFASSLDQIGPFARDVRDAAALLHAIAGRDERDSTSAPIPVPDELLSLPASDDEAAGWLRGKRLGLPKEYFVAGMDPDVEKRIREAVARLEAAGARIEEVSLPHTDYGLATYYIVAPAEASANLARYDGVRLGLSIRSGHDYLSIYRATRGQGFGPEVKRRVMLGTYALSAGYYDAFYVKAQKVRTLIKQDFDRLFEAGFDALVAPTSPSTAFDFGARLSDPVQMYLSDACTLPVNMAGLPGISVPAGLSEGLPVGLQFIGAAWSELDLFRLSRAYEAITAGEPWRTIEPPDLARAADPAEPTPAERAALRR